MDTEQKDNVLTELERKVDEAREGLPENYQRFAEHFCSNKNGARAAIAAGFTDNISAASVQANRLLKNANVMAYIASMNKLQCHKTGITIHQQIWRLNAIADAEVKDYFEWDEETGILKFKGFEHLTPEQSYALEGIKQGKNGLELKLAGKTVAIDMLNKNLGFYEKDNKQKGEGIAQAVGILLPDNTRGKIVVDKDSEV